MRAVSRILQEKNGADGTIAAVAISATDFAKELNSTASAPVPHGTSSAWSDSPNRVKCALGARSDGVLKVCDWNIARGRLEESLFGDAAICFMRLQCMVRRDVTGERCADADCGGLSAVKCYRVLGDFQ